MCEDVDVIVHANYPWPVPSALPVRYLGFDCREVLRRCVEVLDGQRTCQLPEMHTQIPAVFEDEVFDASASRSARTAVRSNFQEMS